MGGEGDRGMGENPRASFGGVRRRSTSGAVQSKGGNWNAFQDFVFQEMAVPIFSNGIMKRGTFTIIFSDGEENKSWLKRMAPRGDSLPVALLIDFVCFVWKSNG